VRGNECPNCGGFIIRPEPEKAEVAQGAAAPQTAEGEARSQVNVMLSVQELVEAAQKQENSGDLHKALATYQQALTLAKEHQLENPAWSLTVQMLTHAIRRTEQMMGLASELETEKEEEKRKEEWRKHLLQLLQRRQMALEREEAARREAEERARREEQARQKRAAEERARREAEEREKKEAEVRAKHAAEKLVLSPHIPQRISAIENRQLLEKELTPRITTPPAKVVPQKKSRRPIVIGGLLLLGSVLLCVGVMWITSLPSPQVIEKKATSTSDWTATAYAVKTATARAAATATAQARAIAEAQATATAQARADIISAIESNKLRAFGPEDGGLVHDVDEYIEDYAAGVELRDFIVEAEFLNPCSASTGSWDYGFLFRDEGGDQQFRLIIGSDRYWTLFNVVGDADVPAISEGEIPTLNINEGGSNWVRLICQGGRGWLFVNGEFIAEFDLSARTNAGDITIATGMYGGDEIEGKTTYFENFSIWSIIQIVNTLTYNDRINSSINDAIGEYWSFYGRAGDRVTIAMDGYNSFDTYLELYDPNEDLLVSNDDDGPNNNALIVDYVLPVTGTYIINARGYNGATGSYTLSLTGP